MRTLAVAGYAAGCLALLMVSAVLVSQDGVGWPVLGVLCWVVEGAAFVWAFFLVDRYLVR